MPPAASEVSYEDLFHAHFAGLVRLAALVGADDPADVAQEAFARLHLRRRLLRDPGAALGYLRTTVVNLSRSRLRHLSVVRRHRADPLPAASAEAVVLRGELERTVVAAVKRLPGRQREAVVLRYWCELSVEQVAAAMGISQGSVKTHTSRGLAAVAQHLGSSEARQA